MHWRHLCLWLTVSSQPFEGQMRGLGKALPVAHLTLIRPGRLQTGPQTSPRTSEQRTRTAPHWIMQRSAMAMAVTLGLVAARWPEAQGGRSSLHWAIGVRFLHIPYVCSADGQSDEDCCCRFEALANSIRTTLAAACSGVLAAAKALRAALMTAPSLAP